jgi:hypothetical protein
MGNHNFTGELQRGFANKVLALHDAYSATRTSSGAEQIIGVVAHELNWHPVIADGGLATPPAANLCHRDSRRRWLGSIRPPAPMAGSVRECPTHLTHFRLKQKIGRNTNCLIRRRAAIVPMAQWVTVPI